MRKTSSLRVHFYKVVKEFDFAYIFHRKKYLNWSLQICCVINHIQVNLFSTVFIYSLLSCMFVCCFACFSVSVCVCYPCPCACVHLIHNWSMLAEAPVRDPSPPQAEGPNAAVSPTQMDLTASGLSMQPPQPSASSPTDGVSQWERRFKSIPIKAWPASTLTFRRCVS